MPLCLCLYVHLSVFIFLVLKNISVVELLFILYILVYTRVWSFLNHPSFCHCEQQWLLEV